MITFHPISRRKIYPLQEFLPVRRLLSREGQKLVFTNGCFDLLHAGHIDYLEKARALGDCLVIAINSDASVREIKGDARPIIPEQERAEVLAALQCVDFVTFFSEPTPHEIIQAILPDVLVKGSDWALDEIVGRTEVETAGGRVVTIDFLPGYSTSSIINTILRNYGKKK
jgi:D-beta-D-heptose 7-phosphate kinase/D-beta-D-heptose 1-phosphate adenosyltransferase